MNVVTILAVLRAEFRMSSIFIAADVGINNVYLSQPEYAIGVNFAPLKNS